MTTYFDRPPATVPADPEKAAHDLLCRHFRLRIDGDRSHTSQFNVPYVTWVNGHIVKHGDLTPNTRMLPTELLRAFEQELADKAKEFDVVVLRRFPEFQVWHDHEVMVDGNSAFKHRLSVRWHFMTKEDL